MCWEYSGGHGLDVLNVNLEEGGKLCHEADDCLELGLTMKTTRAVDWNKGMGNSQLDLGSLNSLDRSVSSNMGLPVRKKQGDQERTLES